MVKEPHTTTLTKFRNGDLNLHYVHVNKDERGRTCRACHEVHAAKQPHQIRDAVPYGNTGYMLKVNFTQTPNGGSCAKTCHVTRSYTNSVAPLVLPAAAPKKAEADGSPADNP
jgi:polyferredoxin